MGPGLVLFFNNEEILKTNIIIQIAVRIYPGIDFTVLDQKGKIAI